VTAEQALFDRVHEKVIEIWHVILHWENWKIFEGLVSISMLSMATMLISLMSEMLIVEITAFQL
jgi:hypothetical protein